MYKRIDENSCVVYLHINKLTGIVFYVGIGSEKRAYNFYNGCRGMFWKNYVKKHGTPLVSVVAKGIPFGKAAKLEKEYISRYGRRGIDKDGILVNRSIGGELSAKGFRHTEDAKRRISEALKNRDWTDESKKKLSNTKKGSKQSDAHKLKNSLAKTGKNHPNYGKHLSDETKEKIRIGNIGKEQNHPLCRKVINTVTKEVYRSARYVAINFLPNIHPNSINGLLDGSVTNWTDFQYLDDYNKGIKKFVCTNTLTKPKKVKSLITGGIYESALEASRHCGVSDGTIRLHAMGKVKISPKFVYV